MQKKTGKDGHRKRKFEKIAENYPLTMQIYRFKKWEKEEDKLQENHTQILHNQTVGEKR